MGRDFDPTIWECAWWNLVSIVGEDMWRTTLTFAKTETFEELFSKDEIAAIFRFGQYMTLLKWPKIEDALRFVAARKFNQPSGAPVSNPRGN